MSEVRKLVEMNESLIQRCKETIENLQKDCKHKKLLHKAWIQYQGCQSGSTHCYDCKKMISSYSGLLVDEAVDKEWITEREENESQKTEAIAGRDREAEKGERQGFRGEGKDIERK